MASSVSDLLSVVCCPNCWHEFPPDQFHFISTSNELAFDHVLGAGRPRVFLPSNFTPQGDAIDPGGGICSETACPMCHLPVPRLLAQFPTISISIFGSPGSGKSFLLASMTHMLMQQIVHYGLTAEDADPLLNAIMRDYERILFNPESPEQLVVLRKTEEVGDWYNSIQVGGRERVLPKPFLYRLERFRGKVEEGRVLCLYDNAGESFEPGTDSSNSPVTRHMAKADVLMFVFDPTQERSFRLACADRSSDPQWTGKASGGQTALFTEATKRVRNFKSMLPTDTIQTPLIVLLPKFDAWSFLLGENELPKPYREVAGDLGNSSARTLDVEALLQVGKQCRSLLQKYEPSLLAKIESTFNPKNTIYLPVSATGCSPTKEKEPAPKPQSLDLGALEDLDLGGANLLADEQPKNPDNYGAFRAKEIQPIWAEMPLLAALRIAAPRFLSRSSG